ncbi:MULTISPECIES: hypothetical protein [unclassified Microcoleus]|uniref:hypothetical protein n=1 Tax=unclassified Microcoleus TaxID=2642155 RepID=UPI002FD71C55
MTKIDTVTEMYGASGIRTRQSGIRTRHCRVPTNGAIDHFVVGKRHCRVLHRPIGRWLYSIPVRFYPLPEIRRRQCRVPTNRAIDHFVVGKRHCRVLHRTIGRWLYPIGRSIILW